MKILIVNVGSTSLKYKLFKFPEEEIIFSGKIENIRQKESLHTYTLPDGQTKSEKKHIPGYDAGIKTMLNIMLEYNNHIIHDTNELSSIGFKTVHGGFLSIKEGAQLLNDEVLEVMTQFSDLAPAHNPHYIKAIKAFQKTCPDIPLYGLFEPEFHRTIPEYARTFGVPYEWKTEYGVQKYGFHGASHRYISERTGSLLNKNKIISCHLGGSSSICAIENGKSIDTTMEFSPQSGILQSTRCESLDPFIILHLQHILTCSADFLIDLLCTESGLKGISGISGDIPTLEASDNERAKLALEVFIYQIQKSIGSMAASLNGAEAIVFTGGIGERGAGIREKVAQKLTYLRATINPEANNTMIGKEGRISTHDSKTELWVIPTNEEIIVAREVAKKI